MPLGRLYTSNPSAEPIVAPLSSGQNLGTSLEELDLSNRVLWLLHRAGIHSVEDLGETTMLTLLEIRGLGDKSTYELCMQYFYYMEKGKKAKNDNRKKRP